jgi:hypothetical protein
MIVLERRQQNGIDVRERTHDFQQLQDGFTDLRLHRGEKNYFDLGQSIR